MIIVHPTLYAELQRQLKARFDDQMPLGAIRIVQSPLALVKTDVPKRKHRRRHWDRSGRYHARIQKKWNKRFGFVEKPGIFQMSDWPLDFIPPIVEPPKALYTSLFTASHKLVSPMKLALFTATAI